VWRPRYFIGGKHIVGAVFDGPASKTEGIAGLRTAVRTLSKDAAVVIYSGCCLIEGLSKYSAGVSALRELGFKNLYVLDLPTNFHTD